MKSTTIPPLHPKLEFEITLCIVNGNKKQGKHSSFRMDVAEKFQKSLKLCVSDYKIFFHGKNEIVKFEFKIFLFNLENPEGP